MAINIIKEKKFVTVKLKNNMTDMSERCTPNFTSK